ncbi:unnamed protein product [Danaus chrysippus]|uniref:(African queen) hypothetical protein n=1 Tax=Danaus chrysippus TaxID=151541 RepID=A0A8J2VZK6_9NEOP|nr:unnamed protein product [Danaus chrysippus]
MFSCGMLGCVCVKERGSGIKSVLARIAFPCRVTALFSYLPPSRGQPAASLSLDMNERATECGLVTCPAPT